jgi:DNA-binding response OmpR family regulator
VTRVLVVEDDPGIAEALRVLLDRNGFTPWVTGSGPAGCQALARDQPDAVLLDLSPPGLDGAEFLCRLREEGSTIPVLVVTASASTASLVRILELGADDYVVKPYRGPEVVARLRAALRRAGGQPAPQEHRPLTGGVLRLDLQAREATASGRPVALSPTEFRLLQELLEHAGQMRPAEEIIVPVWGSSAELDRSILRVNVYRLRRKLDAVASGWGHIRGSTDGYWGLFLNDPAACRLAMTPPAPR